MYSHFNTIVCHYWTDSLPLLDKPINPGVPHLSSRNNNNQTHLD